jgi:hypothetical protein
MGAEVSHEWRDPSGFWKPCDSLNENGTSLSLNLENAQFYFIFGILLIDSYLQVFDDAYLLRFTSCDLHYLNN